MIKVHVVWLVFLQVRVKHYYLRDFSRSFWTVTWTISNNFCFIIFHLRWFFFCLFSADAAYFNSRFLGWLSHCSFKSVVFPVFLKVVQPPTLQHDGKLFLLRLIYIATHLNETMPWADNYLILIIKTDRKKEGKVKYYIECLVCKYKDCLQFSYCFAIIISNNI